MSENLDLVRSIYANMDRGEIFSGNWAHPEIEFGWADGPSPGICTGIDEAGQAWRDFRSPWDEYSVEVEDCRELGSQRVLALTCRSWHGRTSDVELGYDRRELRCLMSAAAK
jgi:hypothetical protein